MLPMLQNYPIVRQPIALASRDWSVSCVADQDTLLSCVRTDEDLAAFPFGMLLWASAISLAQRPHRGPLACSGKARS